MSEREDKKQLIVYDDYDFLPQWIDHEKGQLNIFLIDQCSIFNRQLSVDIYFDCIELIDQRRNCLPWISEMTFTIRRKYD